MKRLPFVVLLALGAFGCSSQGIEVGGPVDETDDSLEPAPSGEPAPGTSATSSPPDDDQGKPEPDPWKKNGTAHPKPTDPSVAGKPEPDPWSPGSNGPRKPN